jgi:hypothetical protein
VLASETPTAFSWAWSRLSLSIDSGRSWHITSSLSRWFTPVGFHHGPLYSARTPPASVKLRSRLPICRWSPARRPKRSSSTIISPEQDRLYGRGCVGNGEPCTRRPVCAHPSSRHVALPPTAFWRRRSQYQPCRLTGGSHRWLLARRRRGAADRRPRFPWLPRPIVRFPP